MSTEIVMRCLEREGNVLLLPIELRIQTLLHRWKVLEFVDEWRELGNLQYEGGATILSEDELKTILSESGALSIELPWAMAASDEELLSKGLSRKAIEILNRCILEYLFPF